LPITAAAIAASVQGVVDGDAETSVDAVAPLDRAGAHELSVFAHVRYASWYRGTAAGVVVTSPTLVHAHGAHGGARVLVDRPVDAMLRVLALFARGERRPSSVHREARVSESATLGANVVIEAGAVIGEHVVLADGVWVGANAVVGAETRIGADSRIFALATIYPQVEIGARVQVHSGARVGREGFGFVPQAGGVSRVPHVGRCVLGDDVEIGANSCIDRGSIDDTVIGAGTKIDNLVHVAHNTRIGRLCFIAAQVGIAGSTRIEDGVQLGGQVGISGHLTIGAHATLAAQAGVFGDVPTGQTWSGYPARPHKEQLKAQGALFRLARLLRPLERLVANTETGDARAGDAAGDNAG
jgi:UDP-3-O-[3-hydroxymyristoyl] glucosamine N-acyltransferase